MRNFKIEIYIPDQDKNGCKFTAEYRAKCIKETMTFFNKLFNNCTGSRGFDGWSMWDDVTIFNRITIIQAYTSPTHGKFSEQAILKHCEHLRNQMYLEQVRFVLDGTMYII